MISILLAPSLLQIGAIYLAIRGISGRLEIPILILIMIIIIVIDVGMVILVLFGVAGDVNKT